MKSTKRSLLLSAFTLLLCVCMLIGTTYAWFTDSVTSGNNTIEAGNLDVEVFHTNASVQTEKSITGRTDLFTDINGEEMKWEPGAISYETFTVKNVGQLPFKYNSALDIKGFNTLNDHSLKEALRFKVLTGTDMLTNITRVNVENLGWSNADTLESLDVYRILNEGRLESGKDEKFQVFVYWMPTEDDSVYNVRKGDKTSDDATTLNVKFGIEVVAYQDTVESDAFGKTETEATAECIHRYEYSYAFKANSDGTELICTATAECPKCHDTQSETVGCTTKENAETGIGSKITHKSKDFKSDGIFVGKNATITFECSSQNANGIFTHTCTVQDGIRFIENEKADAVNCIAKEEATQSPTCICCGSCVAATHAG